MLQIDDIGYGFTKNCMIYEMNEDEIDITDADLGEYFERDDLETGENYFEEDIF